MKNTLPLLLASSLVWHAAAWADEWTNIATAVTVTEGRLCAGELAADGTGTDILCDTDHPSIDSSGNVVVSGEVSATTLNATQLCDEDGANCRDLSDASSMVVSTTTMVSGWPDAIVCTVDSHSGRYVYYQREYYPGSADVDYYATDAARYVVFNADYMHKSEYEATDCAGKSIATLYSEGKAFNFLGNNGAQISLTEIADVSASTPSDGQVLSWDNSAGEWIAADASAGVSALASLTDVTISSPVSGSILTYNASSGEWVNVASASNTALVAFTVGKSANQTASNGDVIQWESKVTDTANAFDLANNHFVAPVDGTYYFHADILGQNNTSSVSLAFYKNNISTGLVGFSGQGSSQFHKQATLSGVFVLNKDDIMDIRAVNTNFIHNNGQVRFSGFLLSGGGGGSGSASAMTDLTDVSDTTPTEGQLLSYDASAGEWVPRTVVSETIILNSADVNACVVTGGVRKLSFNPSTGRLRVCRP